MERNQSNTSNADDTGPSWYYVIHSVFFLVMLFYVRISPLRLEGVKIKASRVTFLIFKCVITAELKGLCPRVCLSICPIKCHHRLLGSINKSA